MIDHNLELMNLYQLHHAQVLARKLHFTKAAEEINIVQPALSRQIKQLEEEIGAQLFKRNNRNVELTPAGAYFIGETELLLHHLERVKRRTGQIHRGEAGEVRIGFTHSVMQTILPGILKLLKERFPEMRTILKEMNNGDQYQALQKRELDLGFATNPLVPPGLRSKVLLVDNFVVLLPRDHPVDRHNFTDFSVFAHEDFIFPSLTDGIHYVRTIESICLDAGFRPRVVHETDSATTGFRLVEAGLGISIEPLSSLRQQLLSMKSIELTEIPQRAELTMMWSSAFEGEFPQVFDILGAA